jgi:hypothetical protein
MPVEKINCGVKALKKGERRGTMQECIDKKQVRYYGIKTIDKVLLDEVLKKKKPEKVLSELSIHEIAAAMNAMIHNIKRKREYQEEAKKKKETTKVDKFEKEINALKTKYKKYEKRLKQLELEVEKEKELAKQKKDAEKKASKKTSKKTSKKSSKKKSKKDDD